MIPSDISTWNVMAIDDEAHNAGVLQIVFEFHKVRFRSASTGKTGLEMIRVERPSFVLLDISMPVMSGHDVLQEIRNDPQLADLCVIALTAHAMANDRENFLAAGFNGYIPKPISAFTILSDIMQILQHHYRRVTPS